MLVAKTFGIMNGISVFLIMHANYRDARSLVRWAANLVILEGHLNLSQRLGFFLNVLF